MIPEKLYDDGLCQVYHGQFNEGLMMVENMETTIITDPPFNIDYHYKGFKDKQDDVLYHRQFASIIEDGPAVLIHYPEFMFDLAVRHDCKPTKTVPWVYNSNTARQHRMIAWYGCKPDFTKGSQPYKNPNDKRIRKRIAEGKTARLYDWWEINQVKNVSKKHSHPCEMPLEVMDRIIKVTQPSFVLDPFCGTGTTLVACKMNRVKCIGFDIVREYADIAVKRLTETTSKE